MSFPGEDRDGIAEYVRIKQQPTALQSTSDPRLTEMEQVLRQRGFSIQRVTDMDGWLVYHAAFVACVKPRCKPSPTKSPHAWQTRPEPATCYSSCRHRRRAQLERAAFEPSLSVLNWRREG